MPGLRLSLDALLVLDAIDRQGSFAAAAEELHRVPSAITYQIQKLEADLDVLLFDRSGHRARLTAAGRELLDAGRVLLASANELEHRVRRIATGWEPELRVAVDAVIPFRYLWPMVAQFLADCSAQGVPQTRLKLTREVLGGSWDAMVEGRADLVIGAPGDAPSGAGLRVRRFAELNAVFAVAPSHPLARHPEPIPSRVVAQHRVVVAADSSRRLPPRSIGLGDGPDTLTVPDIEAKIAAQVAGLGCGFVPLHLAQSDIAAGRLVVRRIEDQGHTGPLSIAWRAERPGNALQWWIDAIQRSGLGETIAAGARLSEQRSVKRRAARRVGRG